MQKSSNFSDLFQQAKSMRENIKFFQKELSKINVSSESGAGMVKVIMNCKHELLDLKIEPNLMNTDNEMLEDLVIAAVNSAVKKVKDVSNNKMKEIMPSNMPDISDIIKSI